MLDVRRLRVLREVAACGSFSAAAESLSYTQSAISQQIAALEREAGTRLVERSARGIALTEAGRALVRHAGVILANLADAEAELEAIAGLRGGRLRIGAFPSAGSSLMPAAIALFRERHPGVELALEVLEPEDGLDRLRAATVDLSLDITGGTRRATDDGIDRLHLLDDPMYVILPAGHPVAARSRVRLADLSEESWLGSSAGGCPDSSVFLRSCQLAGFEPRVIFESDDYSAIQGFVAAGMGVSFIPALALTSVREDIVVRSLGARPPVRTIWAATLGGSFHSPAKEAMLRVLGEVAGELGGARPELAMVS
jgi:DNA-binding transcriptional LysR family regulator